jgi:hypothetical protein
MCHLTIVTFTRSCPTTDIASPDYDASAGVSRTLPLNPALVIDRTDCPRTCAAVEFLNSCTIQHSLAGAFLARETVLAGSD